VAYFGDTTGNHDYSGLDAQRIARVWWSWTAASRHSLDRSGVIADVTGNGELSVWMRCWWRAKWWAWTRPRSALPAADQHREL